MKSEDEIRKELKLTQKEMDEFGERRDDCDRRVDFEGLAGARNVLMWVLEEEEE